MLTLTSDDIKLGQTASNKLAAIKNIAHQLQQKQLVEPGYVNGMLEREQQSSTYLGNGIAIPHGTTQTRDQVINTGVSIFHFPNGVDWHDGNTVYLAIGIAAKSDEHLAILKQLTKVLSADGIDEQLKMASDADQLIDILQGNASQPCQLDPSQVSLSFPADDMLQLSVAGAGLLKNQQCVSAAFVADIIEQTPTDLGNGLWLLHHEKHVNQAAASFVSVASPFQYQQKSVKGLITLAGTQPSLLTQLTTLVDLVWHKRQETLFNQTDKAQLVALLQGQDETPTTPSEGTDSDTHSAVFTINNAHGLHARPGAMLVAEAKRFQAKIQVANLNGDSKSVNAKSLMKVIAMGVLKGHQLQFTAQGEDAAEALDAIGNIISQGLGEA